MQRIGRGNDLHDAEAWGDYATGEDERISVQELFARTRQGTPTPRDGQVGRSHAIGFTLDRSSFWMLCAGAVVAVLLVFLAGFLLGIGTAVKEEVEVTQVANQHASQPATRSTMDQDAPLPPPNLPPAPSIDPRIADLGPPPSRTAIPAMPPGTPLNGTRPPPAQSPEAPAEAAPPPIPALQPQPQPLQLPPQTRESAAPSRPPIAEDRAAGLPQPPAQVAPAQPNQNSVAARAEGAWVLQFGAFRGRENADRLAASLEGKASGIRVEQAPGPNGQSLFYVRAGAFQQRQDADAEAARLKAAHSLNAFVTRR